MVRRTSPVILVAALALSQAVAGQSSPDTTAAHCAAAKAIAGADHINLYNRFAEVCGGERPSPLVRSLVAVGRHRRRSGIRTR